MSEQIKAKVICHSKSAYTGKEIVTFELEYPRFIHGELMTHRTFSRNAMSSRAVPVAKMIEQVREVPAVPVHWGKNQPGMQAKEELAGAHRTSARIAWNDAAQYAARQADVMSIYGAHKQIVNRILEPFQVMKTVVTATEWENFFWLRNHEDAQPEIKRLAELMLKAKQQSTPKTLWENEWHVPYVKTLRNFDGRFEYCVEADKEAKESFLDLDTNTWYKEITLEEALAISASCCAQVSYRLLDDSLEKAMKVYQRLVESEPVHASPFEHQACPMQEPGEFWDEDGDYCLNLPRDLDSWEIGVTHVDRNFQLWSGNFCGFIQHRQLIPNNVKKG